MRRNTAKIEGEKLRPGMPSSRVAITTLRVKMEWQGDAGADTQIVMHLLHRGECKADAILAICMRTDGGAQTIFIAFAECNG